MPSNLYVLRYALLGWWKRTSALHQTTDKRALLFTDRRQWFCVSRPLLRAESDIAPAKFDVLQLTRSKFHITAKTRRLVNMMIIQLYSSQRLFRISDAPLSSSRLRRIVQTRFSLWKFWWEDCFRTMNNWNIILLRKRRWIIKIQMKYLEPPKVSRRFERNFVSPNFRRWQIDESRGTDGEVEDGSASQQWCSLFRPGAVLEGHRGPGASAANCP